MFLESVDFIGREILSIMVSFSDGLSGNLHNNAIGFLLAMWFFTYALITLSKRIILNGPCCSSTLFLMGCCFGLCRNGYMFIMDYGFYRRYIDSEEVFLSVPMMDYALQILTVLCICYAILFISKTRIWFIKYFYLFFLLPFIIYYTVEFLNLNSCVNFLDEKIYHFVLLLMTGITFAICIIKRNLISLSLACWVLFMLLGQIYALLDVYTKKIYTDILNPYHNSFYLWSVPFIMYYIQSIPNRLKKSGGNNA